jgi:hypothetical protein
LIVNVRSIFSVGLDHVTEHALSTPLVSDETVTALHPVVEETGRGA